MPLNLKKGGRPIQRDAYSFFHHDLLPLCCLFVEGAGSAFVGVLFFFFFSFFFVGFIFAVGGRERKETGEVGNKEEEEGEEKEKRGKQERAGRGQI